MSKRDDSWRSETRHAMVDDAHFSSLEMCFGIANDLHGDVELNILPDPSAA